MRLSDPTDPKDVRWLPASLTRDKSSAQMVAFIDARAAMDRFDGAMESGTIQSWSSEYPRFDSERGWAQCRITVERDGQTIIHEDIGYENASGDNEGLKGAFSDAFKRAAVKFGVGRDLYSLPKFWVPTKEQGTKHVPALFPVHTEGRGWSVAGQTTDGAGTATQTRTQDRRETRQQPISTQQRRALFAKLGERGLKEDDLRKAFVKQVAKVDSTKDLTSSTFDKVMLKLDDDEFVTFFKETFDAPDADDGENE